MLVSASIGALSAISGLYLSYYFNIVSGSAIVLAATAIFLVVFLFHPSGTPFKEKVSHAAFHPGCMPPDPGRL